LNIVFSIHGSEVIKKENGARPLLSSHL